MIARPALGFVAALGILVALVALSSILVATSPAVIADAIPQTSPIPTPRYIRAGATGRNDGSNWTNAWTDLNSVPWVRGQTYYVASGTYDASKSPKEPGIIRIDKPESGSQWIRVKKATAKDHGTEAGWQAPFGTGSADIHGKLQVGSGYFEMDGQAGSDDSGHGFRVINPTVGGNVLFVDFNKDHIHLYHVEIKGSGSPGTVPYGTTVENGLYLNGENRTDVHVAHCWIRDVNRDGVVCIGFNGKPGFLFEHNRVEHSGGHADPAAHGQGMDFGIQAVNAGVTIRFNKFIDIDGSANIAFLGGSTNRDIRIYGNIFENTRISTYTSSPGVIWTREGDPKVTVDGLYVYNNTFHVGGLAQIANDAAVSSNVFIRNNLWERSGFTGGTYYRGGVADHNYFYQNYTFSYKDFGNTKTPASIELAPTDKEGVASAFVDSAHHDFHLVSESAAKDAGADLGAPYNVDFDGNPRPQGAAWDIGAYEYKDGEKTPKKTAQ